LAACEVKPYIGSGGWVGQSINRGGRGREGISRERGRVYNLQPINGFDELPINEVK